LILSIAVFANARRSDLYIWHEEKNISSLKQKLYEIDQTPNMIKPWEKSFTSMKNKAITQ
jgi:hypothetical protein